tara:strand:- start:1040 stop:1531 length:492 start_codon:yes stop_codon:yes gene_type:complete
MIIVRKNVLTFNDTSYTCAIGKNGVSSHKKEGDGCTPSGEYSLGNIYFREDRVVLPDVELSKVIIDQNTGWCDDINSNDYNRPITLPFKYSAERLYREDNVYDIICVINYNLESVIKGKGSAIFMHIATDSYSGTEGCIALKQDDLIQILSQINLKTKINIIA